MKKKNISYLYSIIVKVAERDKPFESQFLSENKLTKEQLSSLSKTFDKAEKGAILYHGIVVSNDNLEDNSYLF